MLKYFSVIVKLYRKELSLSLARKQLAIHQVKLKCSTSETKYVELPLGTQNISDCYTAGYCTENTHNIAKRCLPNQPWSGGSYCALATIGEICKNITKNVNEHRFILPLKHSLGNKAHFPIGLGAKKLLLANSKLLSLTNSNFKLSEVK